MPLKKIKRAFKKITKPVAKVLDKVVPNEIKPFLPYAAAFVPFMAPASFGIGSLSPMVSRAILAGGTNLAAQLAQEGSEGDFSGLSALLAAGTGALSTPGAADTLRGAQTVKGTPFADVALESADATLTSGGFFEGAKNVGLEGLAKTADFLNVAPDSGGIGDILRPGGTELTLKNIAKAGSIPFTQGSTDLAMATARKALQDYEAELAAFNAQAGANQEASDSARRAAIIASMTRADFTQDIIDETLGQLGLKDGGIARLGFDNGGTPVFTKGSILKDKDTIRLFKDADQIKSTISTFIEEERAPNVSEIMDVMKFMEKAGEREEKLTDKFMKRKDLEEIMPYGVFVKDEEGFLKYDEKGDFIMDKSKINPRRREPVEILMGDLIMKKKEKELDELDKKFTQMLKDKGLLKQSHKDQDTAYRIMDLTEKYKNKQLAKQADADSMLGAFGYGEINKANGGIARLGFDNGGDVEGIMRVSEIKKAPKDDYDFNDPSWWEQQILKDLNFYKTNSLDASPFNMAYMMNAVNEYSKLGGDPKRAKELANMVQNFINEDAAKFQSLSEEEKKQRITRDKESLDRQLEETGRTAPPGFANPDGIEYTRDIEFKEVKDGGIIGLRNGGRIGFDNGGDVSFGGITEAVKNVEQKPRKFLVDKLEVTQEPGQSEMRAIIEAMYNDIDDIMPEDRKREFYQLYAPQMLRKGEMDETEFKFIQTEILGKKMKKGGIASLKDDGIMDLGGKEMDMRGGGFIPIGAKERADDVPARLSKNEFVMTADAVRAAGGGSVNKGAKRMYDLMHNLEARA